MEALRGMMKRLEDAVDEEKTRIADLKKQKQQLSGEVSDLKKRKVGLEEEICQLEGVMGMKNKEVAELKGASDQVVRQSHACSAQQVTDQILGKVRIVRSPQQLDGLAAGASRGVVDGSDPPVAGEEVQCKHCEGKCRKDAVVGLEKRIYERLLHADKLEVRLASHQS
jgi:hypothetical protein